MDQALFQYRLYDRAARLAVNPQLKEEFAQKAKELRDNPPISDHEKYHVVLMALTSVAKSVGVNRSNKNSDRKNRKGRWI